jgi:hypothetical protein
MGTPAGSQPARPGKTMMVWGLVPLIIRDHFPRSRLAILVVCLLIGAGLVRTAFYSTAGAEIGAGVIGIFGGVAISYRFTNWANSSIGYAFVLRRWGRLGYLAAVCLAGWLVASTLYLVVRLIASLNVSAPFSAFVLSCLPLIGCLALVVVVLTFLSSLVLGTEWFRTIFLALLALSIYREQLGELEPRLRWILDVFWMSLVTPVVGALHLSTTWGSETDGLRLAGIIAVETVLLLVASIALFSHRDLSWN